MEHVDALRRLLAARSGPLDRALPAILDRAGVALVLLDERLRFVHVNDVAAAINGMTPAEHLARPLAEVLPGIPLSFHEALHRCLATGEPLLGEEVVGRTPASPDERTWQVSAVRVELAEHEEHLVAVVFMETTEVRRAEQRLRKVIDGLFTFVGLCAPDGTLLEANAAALVAGGLESSDVVGRPFWESYWWSHDPAVQQRLRVAVADAAAGRPSRYDVPVRVAGGDLITIDFQLVPIVEGGRVTALVPSGLDITERRARADRLLALASLSARLSGTVETTAIVGEIVDGVERALGCDHATLGLVDVDARCLRLFHSPGMPASIAEASQALPLDGPATPLHDALRQRRAVFAGDARARARRYPAPAATFADLGLAASAAVPLFDGVDPIGVLAVGWRRPSQPIDELRAQVTVFADLCGQALARARRTDASASFVDRLLLRVLDAAPAAGTLDVATRYLPAEVVLRAGGDWYDVVAIDDVRTAVVVGDIVGHGVTAAAQMAILKSVVRALVLADPTLTQLPLLAGRALAPAGEEYLGTAMVAVIDPPAGTARLLSFGHPPAVRRSGASASLCPGGRALPLGLRSGPVRPEVIELAPGDALVLFTDGLIERRHRDVDEGLARLVAAAAGTAGDAEQLADHLLAALRPPGPRRDDLALLVARLPAGG